MRFRNFDDKGGIRGFLLNLLVFLAVLGLAFFLARRYFAPPSASIPPPVPVGTAWFNNDPAGATDQLLKSLNQRLQESDFLKLLERDVETRPATVNGKVFSTYVETFRLPADESNSVLASWLSESEQSQGSRMSWDGKETYTFRYSPDWTAVVLVFETVKKPRLCLIIDDGGYKKGKALEALYGFKVPVTVSIIPDVEFSKSLAQEFPGHGVEVMCHMPMEGHEKGVVGANYKELLKKGMADDQAKAEVEKALENLPNCRGLNNHMGSVATEDGELMADVCDVLKAHGLFIIDSRTTAKSMMEAEAKKAGVPVASRNVFLDNVETPDAILKQLNQAVSYAKRHGLAVAIGHFKPVTLRTLESAIPKLKEEGFQFVYASEAVRDE